MKSISTLSLNIIVFFSFYFGFSQKTIYRDEAGKTISSKEFQEKWESPKYAQWIKLNENGQEIWQLVTPQYKLLQVNYSVFLSLMEQNTQRDFNDQTTFVIEYRYFKDLCTDDSYQWSKNGLEKLKSFKAPWKKLIENEYSNTVFFTFFDEKIVLYNNSRNENECFFTDQKSWLAKTLFTVPTWCGSYAIIEPNGSVLVRNGEHSVIEIQNWLTQRGYKK